MEVYWQDMTLQLLERMRTALIALQNYHPDMNEMKKTRNQSLYDRTQSWLMFLKKHVFHRILDEYSRNGWQWLSLSTDTKEKMGDF